MFDLLSAKKDMSANLGQRLFRKSAAWGCCRFGDIPKTGK
jgi:hypothetical protein